MKRSTRRARSLNVLCALRLPRAAGRSQVGTRHDTSLRANSNRGHAFGVDLPERDQDALLEYLKTL